MQTKRIFLLGITALIILSFMASGCMVNFYKQNPRSKKQIQDLKTQVSDLESQRRKEHERFKEVERLLKSKLQNQIASKSMSLEMADGGLVIILSDDILFNSGKAEIKREAFPILNKVIQVIKTKVPNKNIGISGHTDNVPITRSKWGTNWELSTARATNVLYYLESKGLSPERLSATGYGEHRPIASNRTEKGRAKNRRVEIVILPEFTEQREGVRGKDASKSPIK